MNNRLYDRLARPHFGSQSGFAGAVPRSAVGMLEKANRPDTHETPFTGSRMNA